MQDVKTELTATKYRNEKLVEQLGHSNGEVQRLEGEIVEISSRPLLQRIFNRGLKHEKLKTR